MTTVADAPSVSSIEQFPVQSPETSLLSRVTILAEREGGKIEALVPVELINREDVPVDQDHVNELAESIEKEAANAGGTGQLSPILVGEVPGQAQFLIIDGFHRDAALFQTKRSEIHCTIRTNISHEDVMDLRILTANTHTSVSFARINEWVVDIWDESPWKDKITVVQAFTLATNESSGKKLGLTPEEVEAINEWVRDKSAKWRMSLTTIGGNLKVAELADPELVKEARSRVGGHELTQITPKHLDVIARAFPHEFPMQNLASALAKANNLTVPMTRAMVQKLQEAGGSLEDAIKIAEGTQWNKIAPAHSASHARALARKHQEELPDDIDEAVNLEGTLAQRILVMDAMLGRVTLEALVHKGKYVAPIFPVTESRATLVTGIGPDMSTAIMLNDNEQIIDSFLQLSDQMTPSLTQSLTAKHGYSEADARNVIRAASVAVTEDMEHGDLRFVDLDRKQTMQDLLVKCIGAFIERRIRPDARVPMQPTGTELPNVSTYDYVDVIKSVRSLEDMQRRSFVLRTIMGLSVKSTSQIVGKSESAVAFQVADAQKFIVAHAKRRAAASKLT